MPDQLQNDELVMNLVELALSRPPEHREAYLRSACSSDPSLFEHVWNYIQWEQRMNGFLLEPLCPPVSGEDPFEPGQALVNRFRIVRKVGEGGMAVVYEAVDGKLDRRIAIKCAKTGFHKRLPPEARHAREISHDNVCKIFEIHTASTDHGEVDFLAMEFLEGPPLAERLLQGPLPYKEARIIASQLCAGLAEAHRHQVIHGDLKSNNVILTTGPDGATRAVITDFGLARRLATQQPAAQSGDVGGALDYMAPELLKGERPSVASDIYALAVIFYEMAAGGKPFRGEVSWEGRLTLLPAPLKHRWNGTLGRCLDPNPTRRFASVAYVAKALDPDILPWWLRAAAVAVLAIGIAIAAYFGATPPKESVRLAMLPIEGESGLAVIAANLSREAVDQLGRLTGDKRIKLTVFSLPEVSRKHVGTIAQARATLGATHVLRATLAKEQDKLVLHAYWTDPRSQVNPKEWRVEYAPGEARYAPVALAGFVTGTLHLPPLVAAVAVKAAAQQDYWAGLWDIRQNSTLDAALPLLQRAITADPDSPFTWAALAEAQWFEYYLTKDPVWLDRARESVRQAEVRSPDVGPVHRVQGYLSYAAGFYERAASEFERAIELQPGNSIAYIWLGKAYEDNNQIDQALTEFRKAVEVEPNYFGTYQRLGAFYLQRSNFSEGAKYHKKAVDLAPNEPNLHWALAVAYMDLGWFAEAEQELRNSIGLQETISALHTLGETLMYERRDREAIPYLLRALSLNSPPGGTRRYSLLLYLGIAYRRLGLLAKAEEVNRRGLEMAEGEMARNPRDGYVRGFLGYFGAALGDRRRAESEIAQALRLSPDDSDTRWRAVLAYEALGLRDKTLDLLSTSTAEQLADVNRWPDLADLHQNSRFLELLTSHQVR